MTKGKEAGRIQVYVRVRPFTEKEREKKEINAIALHHDHSLIRVLDPRRDTNYFFDGVFGPESSNYEVYMKVGRPLVYAALNGYKGTLLTYGQTGTGKTYTLLSEDGVTTNVVNHCFERIHDDTIHSYKVTCSFLQVYQEKVYDLLNPRFTVELPVREHPKKGVYVSNLTQNEVKSAEDVLALLEFGKRQLVMAETKMVRHSSRSHSIMQLIIERRLKAHIAMEQASTEELGPKSPENVHDSIMAVDETINNLLKELKQDRKTHHRRERECLRELMEKELDDSHSFKGDVIVKGKINLCDLAGSERLTKTKAEGVRLTEAKYLNTSLLELGNVIHALARGKKRHVPYRNSTLTRLLQDCLGDNGKTNFIVCVAPSLSEINETKCSLNFGLRAMRIINVARLNVEVDYKVLAERLAKKLEDQDRRHKLEKLEYLREIQRLNSAVTSYEESEHVVNSDTDTLVSVIQNLSKSVQREKEEIKSLQSELTCLKRKVAHSPTGSTPDIEALFLAELMSMQLLTHVHQSEAVYEAVRNSDLPRKIKEYLASEWTQQNMVMNTGYMLNLLDTALGFSEDIETGLENKEEAQPKEADDKEDSTTHPEKNTTPSKKTSYVQNGLKKMFELFVGSKEAPKTGSSEQSKAVGKNDKQGATNEGNKVPDLQLISTREMMSRLTQTKEKVEKHVSNLLLSAFGEQLIFSQGNAPQWGVLGRKLSELIMFKRNNIVGTQETEVWSNYENIVSILETCFKYVMIDKALLATMIVIEHMSDKYYPRLPSPGRALKLKALQEAKINQQADKDEASKKVEVKESEEKPSPSKTPKGAKAHLEQEINEVFDDTSRLETELFATMEEKARLEDELIVMKDYVNRLKSDMFHLKIERTNLEKEVKKTAKNIVTLSESNEEQVNSNIMDGYRGLRVGELSDVTEASHESISGESENGSQISEGNEQSAHILKNCLASMAQMYTLMPNQDDDTLTEGNDSDDKDASLSEDDIGESDEDDIIITKIARGIQDYHSPVTSPTKSKKAGKSDNVSTKGEVKIGLAGKQRVAQAKETVQSQRTHETFKDLQVAYEDLEDELYHVRGQLSKAQQIIISLENKMKEEKEHWEQIRKLYLEYKDKNDVLEGKVGILREELEKSLRENTFLKDYHQVDVVREGQVKPHPHSSRSPTRSPSRRKVFDLRNIPSIQNSNRELQIINLVEENTELKTFNDKLTQEKVLAENLSKDKDVKLKGLETTIRFLEEEKETLKEEIETIHRRKFKTVTEPHERLSTAEVELFNKECAQLKRELAVERNLSAKLKNDNQKLTKDLEKMEAELIRWKKGLAANGHIKDEDLTPTNEEGESSKEKWSRNRNNAFQTVFIDDDFESEDEEKMKDKGQRDTKFDTNEELKDLANKLQSEMLSMSEYQEALEKEYGEVKEESLKMKKEVQAKEETIKSLENEVASLKKQGSAKQSENHGTFFSRLNMRASPSKLKTAKEEFDFSKKDQNSYQDYKKFEEEINTLKKENSDLRQQITKCEQKIAIYEGDLQKAMFKIKHLQEERINRGEIEGLDNKLVKTPESIDGSAKPTAADAELYLAASDAKLCKTTKEIERLKEQLLDKEAEKGLLYDELHMIRKRKNELDKALEEAREARRELQEKMDQMAKCAHFEDSVKELTEKNQKLVVKLQQSEDLVKTLTKKHEKQNEKLKSIEEDLVSASGEKLKGDFELRNLVLEIEKAKSDLLQSEQERTMLSTELNEKIEMSTNLEIQLMELKCANECMKSEMEQMKEKKRMESHQNQGKNITRETMEKRLQEAFKTNNYLQSEMESTKEINNDLNEKLSIATKDKDLLEEEVQKLKVKLTHLRVDLDNSASEKKQFESKTKKLEESKKKMEDELKKLKDSITNLQGHLHRAEKQQDETSKKTSNLEKELRRKTKELDNKTRENRRLKKELSSIKESPTTDGEQDGGTEISEVKELRERVDELEKENEDLYSRLANTDATKDKHKRVTFDPNTSQLSNEIGWDFENETLSDEKNDSNKSQAKEDLSEEVGWDLREIVSKYQEEKGVEQATEDSVSIDSVSIKTDEESVEQQSNASDHGNMPTIPEESSKAVEIDQETSMAQICKEKLLLESRTAQLLESKTSHLTKTQMNLESALSKALRENKQLVEKLHDSQIILQRIKSRVQKLEEQTNVNVVRTNAETQTASSPVSTTATQIGDVRLIDGDISPIIDENLKQLVEVDSPTKAGLTASSSKAIVVMTREKKQIAKELETLKQKHEDINQRLTEKEEARFKLEQELNLITTAYEKERESLLQDLERVKKDNCAIKDKLKSQEEFYMSFDEIKKKHAEAERLVTELEKDLMHQTEEKSMLKKELQESKNKLDQVQTIEKELEQLRKENEQVQQTMGKQLEEYKKENEELLEQLENRKKTWQSSSPKKSAQGKKRDCGSNGNKNSITANKDDEKTAEQENTVEELQNLLIPIIVITSPDTVERDFAVSTTRDVVESLSEPAEHVEAQQIKTSRSPNKNKQQKIIEIVSAQQNGTNDSTVTTYHDKGSQGTYEDTVSEHEGETDEEVDIEEKLIKILKERQTMEEEVQSMVQEINTLKSKLTQMQLEHQNNSAEQENANLRKQLEEVANEKNGVDTLVKEMKTKNAQLEIQLSDSIDMKHMLEKELMRLKDLSQDYATSNTEMTEYAEKCQKLEEVLSKVVEENSTLYNEVSSLREENRRLQTSNILEIADGCTQVSPTAFEQSVGASFSEVKNKVHKRNDETPIINVSSPGFHEHAPHGISTMDTIDQELSRKTTKDQVSSSKHRLQLPIDPSTKPCGYPSLADMESKPLSASSPDVSCPAEERVPSLKDVENLENEQLVSNSSHGEFVKVSPESESGYGGSKGGSLCNRCRKSVCVCNQLSRRASTFSTANESTKDGTDLISTESVYGSVTHDVGTDSSFASVTDFEDISFSSDWVSAEDLRAGRITARGHREMSKVHRELAEIKCTNTILENELTILRNRNTDYQSQLQKLSGKNNSLKQKLCERSMIVKKAEKEIEAITEDKMRLEVQVAAAKEEVNRVEREKSKLERILSNTKSENKRLKIDLATLKAESYKNMKTVIKLEAENKKLTSELEESREELKHAKEMFTNFDNTSLTSLDERLSCASPDSREDVLFETAATPNLHGASEIQPRDRTGLTLELKKASSHVRRAASEQTFPRYHTISKDLVTSSESDNLSSPEGYRDRQHRVFAQRLTKSQSMTSQGENRPANLSTTQTEESDTTEVTSTISSDHSQRSKQANTKQQTARTASQMSYDSDMSFPEEREGENCSQSEETEGSIDQEKGRETQQGSIKKMFKRFSKSKKISKPS